MSTRNIIPGRVHACVLLLVGVLAVAFSLTPHPSSVFLVEVPYWLYIAWRLGVIYVLLLFGCACLPGLYRLGLSFLAPIGDISLENWYNDSPYHENGTPSEDGDLWNWWR